MSDLVGYQRLTADGAVGTSGQAVAVFGVDIESGAASAVVAFHNGTGTGDPLVLTMDGTGANANDIFSFAGGQGVVFPDGCYVDLDGNTDAVVVFFRTVGS